jgi:hypothetical protein
MLFLGPLCSWSFPFSIGKIKPLAFYFFNTFALLLGCNEPAYACGGTRVVEDASAAQNIGAGVCPGAEMVLASCVLNNQRQLASGNCSCTKNSGGDCRKNDVLDFLTHGSSSLLQHLQQKNKSTAPSYLAGG